MAKITCLGRSRKYLEDNGYIAAVCERQVPRSFIKIDLFNFADLVAIRSDQKGVLAVQTTSKSNMSARKKKILSLESARVWMSAGNRVQVHGWRRIRDSKGRKKWSVDVWDVA